MEKLNIFIKRLNKIGIKTSFIVNYPWIYIDTINNIKIVDKYASEHGFTVGYLNDDFTFSNLKEIFNIIRKYK